MFFDLLGERSIIDMGVKKEATILNTRRRRRHRTGLLNDIESDLSVIARSLNSEKEDISLWSRKSGLKQNFSTYETWMLLRESKTQCNWARGVCFSQATLKFAFMAWLSIRDRMSTLDRVARWSQGLDDMCVLCTKCP